MSTQKIPDKSNFLEKFSAIKDYLDGNLPKQKSVAPVESDVADTAPLLDSTTVKSVPVDNITQPTLQIEETAQTIKCTSCGADRNDEHKFCFNCGQRYEEQKDTNNSDSVILQQPEEPLVAQIILQCSNCQTPYDMEDVFCMNCGNKLQN